MAVTVTLPGDMPIPGMVMALRMVVMETLSMRVGPIPAVPLMAMVIRQGPVGTGAKMHGIIAADTSIITGANDGRENT